MKMGKQEEKLVEERNQLPHEQQLQAIKECINKLRSTFNASFHNPQIYAKQMEILLSLEDLFKTTPTSASLHKIKEIEDIIFEILAGSPAISASFTNSESQKPKTTANPAIQKKNAAIIRMNFQIPSVRRRFNSVLRTLLLNHPQFITLFSIRVVDSINALLVEKNFPQKDKFIGELILVLGILYELPSDNGMSLGPPIHQLTPLFWKIMTLGGTTTAGSVSPSGNSASSTNSDAKKAQPSSTNPFAQISNSELVKCAIFDTLLKALQVSSGKFALFLFFSNYFCFKVKLKLKIEKFPYFSARCSQDREKRVFRFKSKNETKCWKDSVCHF